MDKTTIAKISTIFLLLLTLMFSVPSVEGVHVNGVWGSTDHPTTFDPDPYWWGIYEQPQQQAAATYIHNVASSQDWYSYNYYGASTTSANVYDSQSIIGNYAPADFHATFHVGDMYPDPIPGGYYGITGYYWDAAWEIWIPEYGWVSTGPTRHYAYYDSNGWPGVEDRDLYYETGAKNRFTFIWTCTNGDIIDIDQDDDLDANDGYGYYDTVNGTGEVGMAYAWTSRTDLSWDGYTSPDNTGWAYIGFENVSKWMCDNEEYGTHNYREFVENFYCIALVSPCTIREALDYATLSLTGESYDFELSWLYTGYPAQGPSPNPPYDLMWYDCRMRVFGDGNMMLPR